MLPPKGFKMPLYEYDCPQCGKFETMKAMEQRYRARCPDCNSESKLVPSVCNHKEYNVFTKDGEGFISVRMSKQEANERAKANAGKYD